MDLNAFLLPRWNALTSTRFLLPSALRSMRSTICAIPRAFLFAPAELQNIVDAVSLL
jgi:hypothetical protein